MLKTPCFFRCNQIPKQYKKENENTREFLMRMCNLKYPVIERVKDGWVICKDYEEFKDWICTRGGSNA